MFMHIVWKYFSPTLYCCDSMCLVPGQQYLNTSAACLYVTISWWSNPTLGGFNFGIAEDNGYFNFGKA